MYFTLLEIVFFYKVGSELEVNESSEARLHKFNPLTPGAVYIRFLHFLLAHYISAFKPVKDKKWH